MSRLKEDMPDMHSSGAVTAVVVTYNSRDHIDDLLDSLPDAFGPVEYRVVVVDNGSTDDTAALVAARGDAEILRERNTGFAGGINRGVRHVTLDGPILVLNPDATLSPGSVPAMLDVLRKPDVGIVAPRMLEADGSLSPSLRRKPSLGRAGGLNFTGLAIFAERIEDPLAYIDEHEVDWAVGAVLLVDEMCYRELNGFDESYFLYSEETDFCLRARDRGWFTLYTPAAEVVHIGGGSGESSATHVMKMINRIRLYGRRHSVAPTWIYFALVFGIEVRRALFGQARSRAAVKALLHPDSRPPELGASNSVIPS